MNILRHTSIAFLLLLLGTSLTQAQGAWPKEKGKGFFKLGQMFLVSNRFYTPEGSITDIKTTGVFISSVYAEFGITNKLTAFTYVPFFFRNTINKQTFSISPNVVPAEESNSFGDFNIGLQYGIFSKGPLTVSSSITLGIPSGETAGGKSQVLQSGDGEFNQLLKLHAGYSFYPAPFYASTYVGVNNRTRDFSDEFHYGLEIGASFRSLFVALKLAAVESFQNGEAATSQTGIFSNNTEFISFGPEISYSIGKGFGISGAVFGAFKGQNILASPSYNIGLVYEIK